MTQQEVLDDFPYLTQEDILASLSFAANRERLLIKTIRDDPNTAVITLY